MAPIRADLSPDLIKRQFSEKTRRAFAFKFSVIGVCSGWRIVFHQRIKQEAILICATYFELTRCIFTSEILVLELLGNEYVPMQ